MITKMKNLPEPLQRQVLFRLGYSFLALLMCAIVFFWTRDAYSVLACIGLFAFFLISAFLLLHQCNARKYIVLSGTCAEVILTTVRKRTKAIHLKTAEHTIWVSVRHRLRKIPVGTRIDLYIAPATTVDERNGIHRIYNYITLEMKGAQ